MFGSCGLRETEAGLEPSARTRFSASLRFAAGVLPPILLAAYPVVSLYQQNQSEIALRVLWPSLGLAVATAVLLFALFAAVTRSAAKAGVASSLVMVALYYFGLVSRDVSGLGLGDSRRAVLWLVLLAAVLAAALRTRKSLLTGVWALTAFGAVLVIFPAAKVVSYRAAHPPVSISDPRLWPSTPQRASISGGTAPDIYYIIPDDYARSDVLKRYFRFDDSRFTSSLRRRGFVLSNDVRSPYSKSELNMASELNFDYLSRLPHILGPSSQDVLLVRKMIEDSRASRILGSLGYRYIHLDSDNITFAGDNPNISRLAAPDNLTYLWLRDSLLRFVGTRFGFTDGATNDRFRDSVRSAFRKLAATVNLPGPKLVLFHTLMPHDPYIFGSQGQPVTFLDTSDTGHSTKFGMRYYVRQLQFVNHELLGVVDAILAHSRTPPVIVIQSDEGFEALPEDWGEAAVQDMRVKGLYAAYLPGRAKARLPRPLNTVNSFRLLFNRYFGTHYRLLPSVSYPELDQPYRFEAMRVH